MSSPMKNINTEQASIDNDQSRILIAGLGNPGRQYRTNRHNIGFMVVDSLAEQLGVEFSRLESKALVTKSDHLGKRLILAKPQTYMNLSGQAVGSLAHFYKIQIENMIVVYDEVDLPFGVLRMRPSGGSAGHKGMASIIERVSSQDFPRLRVGIGRPPGRKEAATHVLQDFSRTEQEELPLILRHAVDAVLAFVTEGIDAAMNAFNLDLFDDPTNGP